MRRIANSDIVHLARDANPLEIGDGMLDRLAAMCPCSVREAVRLFGNGDCPLVAQRHEPPMRKPRGRLRPKPRKRRRWPPCPVLTRKQTLMLIGGAVRSGMFGVVRIEDGSAIVEAVREARS